MFYETAQPIIGWPAHFVHLKTKGKVTYLARIARQALVDSPGDRSLVLLPATDAVASRLSARDRRDYDKFNKLLDGQNRRTAIGAAKKVALDLLESDKTDKIPLAVFKYGVIPVFPVDATVNVYYRGETKVCRIGLVVSFPSNSKAHLPELPPPRGTQYALFRSKGQDSEELIILKGYCIDLFNVMDSYLEEIGNYCGLLLHRSSGQSLLTIVKWMKHVLGTRISIKLSHLQRCLADPKILDGSEIIIARAIVASNLEGVLLGELGSYLTHLIVARYLRLFDLGFDVINAASASFDEFPKRLDRRWPFPASKIAEAVESNALLSTLYRACSDPFELLRNKPSGLEHNQWLTDLCELLKRVQFCEDEGLSLSKCNVFLSHRTDCEFINYLVPEQNKQQKYQVQFCEYNRPGPTDHAFDEEIKWYIWACFAFVSHLSGTELNDGKGLEWIVRELDLALVQDKKHVAVVVERPVDPLKVAAAIRASGVALYELEGGGVDARLSAVASRLDRGKHLHFEYHLGDRESTSNASRQLLAWADALLFTAAEAYFLGWISLFSEQARCLIEFVCCEKAARNIIFKKELVALLGRQADLSALRLNLKKFPVYISDMPVIIIELKQRNRNANSAFVYQSNLPRIVNALFPGIDVQRLSARIFTSAHQNWRRKQSARTQPPDYFPLSDF